MRGPICNPDAVGSVVVDIDVNGDKIWGLQTFTTKVRNSDATAVATIYKATVAPGGPSRARRPRGFGATRRSVFRTLWQWGSLTDPT